MLAGRHVPHQLEERRLEIRRADLANQIANAATDRIAGPRPGFKIVGFHAAWSFYRWSVLRAPRRSPGHVTAKYSYQWHFTPDLRPGPAAAGTPAKGCCQPIAKANQEEPHAVQKVAS